MSFTLLKSPVKTSYSFAVESYNTAKWERNCNDLDNFYTIEYGDAKALGRRFGKDILLSRSGIKLKNNTVFCKLAIIKTTTFPNGKCQEKWYDLVDFFILPLRVRKEIRNAIRELENESAK